MSKNSEFKEQILSNLDSTKGQYIDEEELDILLSRGELLLGGDWEEWMTTYNTGLEDSPLGILKRGGIALGTISKRLDDIEFTISRRNWQ